MQTINYEQLNLCDGDRLLDVGCGEGRHTLGAYLTANIEAVGVDLSQADVQTARKKADDFLASHEGVGGSLEFRQADALALPFEDNSFDKVICSEVLEHVPDYQGVLKEITRVLKPEGFLAVSVPRAWPEEICWRLSKAYHEVEGGHIRIFNAVQLKHDVEALGWTRYAQHGAHALHSPYWWLKCWKWERESKLVDSYHKLLVWDLMERPWITRTAEKVLNPVLGKSVVMYFQRSDV